MALSKKLRDSHHGSKGYQKGNNMKPLLVRAKKNITKRNIFAISGKRSREIVVRKGEVGEVTHYSTYTQNVCVKFPNMNSDFYYPKTHLEWIK